MVKAGEFDYPWGRTRVLQQCRTKRGVVHASGDGPAELKARRWRGGPGGDPNPARDDVGDAVARTLGSFADVVQEGGGDEVGVVVAAIEEPGRGPRGVALVAGGLGEEQGQQGGWKRPLRKVEVGPRRALRRLPELPNSLTHVRAGGRRCGCRTHSGSSRAG